MERKRHIATLAVFGLILFGLGIAFFLTPHQHRSQTERRLLARRPELNAESIFSGDFMSDFEVYMQDQFPAREQWRTLNATARRFAFGLRDHNGYYFAGGHLSQMEFPLNPDAVAQNAARLNSISHNFFEGMNVFYAVIPDKNYFLAPQHGFLALDYDEMMRIIHRHMQGHTYISLFDVMDLDSFYRTDIHWRQETLFPAADRLANGLGIEIPAPSTYTEHRMFPFYGSFHGHAALPVRPDELVFLTNDYTENAIVYTLIEQGRELVFSRYVTLDGEQHRLGVYTPFLFGHMDSYDVFLAGAQAIITVDVPNANTDRELIIFRDSFGSSIAPLLLGGYSRITLVDIRYIPTRLLPQFIEFGDQDVLFLFNTTLFNRPNLLL